MHLNFHFLRFLCPRLTENFSGFLITACFSQSKDELILAAENEGRELYIRLHFLPPQIFYSFTNKFQRAKRNSIDLFPFLIGQKIKNFEVLAFERAFLIQFDSEDLLLIKLHGNRSNILYYPKEELNPRAIFRNELKEDKTLDWKSLRKELSLNKEIFFSLEGNASQFLPTLGKIPREWLKDKGYIEASVDEKWRLMQELMDMLDSPLFSIAQKDTEVYLTLLPDTYNIQSIADPIEALNALFYKALVVGNFENEKRKLLKAYEDQAKKTQNYIQKSSQKLDDLVKSAPPSQLADVIMAHLHVFEGGVQSAELENFYTNERIIVNLKPNQKPQDLAAQLYRKSKNRQLEIQQLENNIKAKKELLEELDTIVFDLQNISEFRDLKNFKKHHKKDKSIQKDQSSLPFRQFEIEGFAVWVGKSAKDNDEMLRNFTHKDDIWLHARQVTGSHVIIRKKGNLKISDRVLERAAALAAFYSKLKTESLAPVIFTEAKYVRKVKGAAPGSVMVDRESVVMVTPQGPDQEIGISS
ncbi:Predicted component of the ribosome quality control (RQC) complex, YloA/Tae2 family, contains fibronectin-binding (FbpA) and DUF814 domains [Algoriphagus faecimaris]|uniref:Predicted component of the ribosome quality control (RQC) complex, YloA/Tae2 family, contains fibronectin-binding (FbpA) and DUF814 domains n=1 Tax=Algoriphagus faecimaris TaxID=686796 RepID=A0A1G6S215_9BACT|nr:Predicted component of the ribosome quality control (RQC) complex, YloA/Tae2 family, contains fibronectin-binding (FbpA) and DUF814 domains [Algoriphagus faecimaris]